jgi:cell division protein FtsQ
MKKFLKILQIVFWILFVAGAGVLVGFAEVEQYDRLCTKINVSIDYGKADILITKTDVDSIILKTAGSLKNKPLGLINTRRIEYAIRQQPYVEKVSVYERNDGNLYVDVVQREPILRIINRNYESFYLDGSGSLLPVNPKFSARVLVANGFIDHSYYKNPGFRINMLGLSDSIFSDSLMTSLYRLAMFITRDPFLRAQIDQIYVNGQQEFELIPLIGNHVIMLGDANDLGEKFARLMAFYRLGLNSIGWNKYRIINIKYRNQVVCSK